MNQFRTRTLEFLRDIWNAEGLGSVPAMTLKTWAIQTYGPDIFPDIDQIEKTLAGLPLLQKQDNASAKRMRRFQHPAAPVSEPEPLAAEPLALAVPAVEPGKPPAPLSPAQVEEPLRPPVKEEEIKAPLLPQLPNTQAPAPKVQDVEKVVAAEPAQVAEIKPSDYNELAGLSAAALTKRFSQEQITLFLESKKAKVKPGASHRQVAAQFLAWLEKNK